MLVIINSYSIKDIKDILFWYFLEKNMFDPSWSNNWSSKLIELLCRFYPKRKKINEETF